MKIHLRVNADVAETLVIASEARVPRYCTKVLVDTFVLVAIAKYAVTCVVRILSMQVDNSISLDARTENEWTDTSFTRSAAMDME